MPVAAHQKLNLCCSKSHDNLCSTQLNALPCVVGVSLSRPLTNLAAACVCMYVRTCICSINIYWSCCKQQKWKIYCVTEIQVTVKADTLWILKWCCFAHIMVLYMHINFPNLACLRHARLVSEQRVAEVCCLVTFGDKIGVL